mmetsp:Transcript_104991/g.321679  ORF Transcript_104991/g.321679 Transcript_104991/m.321679 type:complete len:326 (-) Transcript_104991:1566-2543(-)
MIPIQMVEEGQRHQVADAAFLHRDPVFRLLPAQFHDGGSGGFRARPRKLDLCHALYDVPVNLRHLRRVEGASAVDHDEQQHAACPPISGAIVAQLPQCLRGEIVRGAAKCVRLADDDFCDPHVGQFQIAAAVHEAVLELQVPPDDPLLVEVLQTEGNIRDVEPGMLLLPPEVVLSVNIEQLTTIHGVEHEIKERVVLEAPVELDHELAVEKAQQFPFVFDHALLLDALQVLLAHGLEGELLPRGVVPQQQDQAEAALAQRAQHRAPGDVDPRPGVPLRLLAELRHAEDTSEAGYDLVHLPAENVHLRLALLRQVPCGVQHHVEAV